MRPSPPSLLSQLLEISKDIDRYMANTTQQQHHQQQSTSLQLLYFLPSSSSPPPSYNSNNNNNNHNLRDQEAFPNCTTTVTTTDDPELIMDQTFTPTTMTATSSTASGVHMDSRIWRHLPQGLIDRVLAFLPPPAFFRFRSVCKRWYSLLFSDSFLEAHLRLSPGLPWLAFFLLAPRTPLLYSPSTAGPPPPPAALLLLDPATPAWFRIPLSPLLPRGFSPAASSAGLLCFLSDEPGAKSLLLLNPLSKLSSHLPPSPTPRLFPSVGLAAGPSSLSVVLAGDDSSPPSP